MIDFDGPATSPAEHFDEFEQMFEEERNRALREAQQLARQRVPVDTGALKDDISVDLAEDKIYNTLEYSIYQDLGTRYIEPTYYLTDSARDAWQNSIDRLQS